MVRVVVAVIPLIACRYVNAADAGGRKLALIPAGVTAGGASTTCTGIPSPRIACAVSEPLNTNPSGWTATITGRRRGLPLGTTAS